MLELLEPILEILRDLPTFLDGFVEKHGIWIYVLLFAIIFAETGLVIMPFLPGDSLLFAAGAVAARGGMNPWALSIVLIVAAVIGDAVNYHIGKWVGPRVFNRGASIIPRAPGERQTRMSWLMEKTLNRKHLDRAHAFFEKYGGKAVVLARFVPIVRTFVPFVAGAGAMKYSRFVFYNVFGAFLWIGICVGGGWYFGNIPWVQRNFEAVIIAIIVVSLIPLVVEYILAKRRAAIAGPAAGGAVVSAGSDAVSASVVPASADPAGAAPVAGAASAPVAISRDSGGPPPQT